MTSKTKMSEPSAEGNRRSTSGVARWVKDGLPRPLLSSTVYTLTVHYHHPTVGEIQNVIHATPDTDSPADVTTVCEDLISAFLDANQDSLVSMISEDSQLAGYSARRLQGGSPTATSFVGLGGTGGPTIDNSAIACNIAFIPGQSPWHYGHFYVPLIYDLAFAANEFSLAYTNKADVLAQSLIDPWQHTGGSLGLTWHAVIWSHKLQQARPIARFLRQARPVAIGRRLRPWLLGT